MCENSNQASENWWITSMNRFGDGTMLEEPRQGRCQASTNPGQYLSRTQHLDCRSPTWSGVAGAYKL